MAYRGCAAAWLLVAAACGGAADERPEEVVFRVGATAGLSEFVPGASLQGSSAAAADLVYELGPEHLDAIERDGARLLLKRRPGSPFSAEQLAASLRSRGLVSSRVLGPDQIEAVFGSVSVAESTHPWNLAFDIGPFGIESQERGRVRLRRRGQSAIDVIEIVEVPASDEWRKLMARELDVMSSSPELFRDQFAGMSSVRLVEIPATISATLFFNVGDPALENADVRRRIAAGLNREAIALVATGNPSTASRSQLSAPDGEAALPVRLSLLVGQDESTMLLAASVIRHQLGRLNIEIDVEALDLERLGERLDRGDHQLALGPLPRGERRFGRFRSPGPDRTSMSGFADPEFDAAATAGDRTSAQAILDRAVPAAELYEMRSFAAIDARFCGDVTPSDTSWRWMADLHLCKNGEGKGKGTP